MKKRNRHSGDFYQWNHYQQQFHPAPNNIVIPVNRFSMFENRLLIDPDPRMETLDRRIPGEGNSGNGQTGLPSNSTGLPSSVADLWKVPILSRPPISGTGHRILANAENYGNQRRSCDLSGSTGKLLDAAQTSSSSPQNSNLNQKDSDVKTDVNRNVTSNNNVQEHGSNKNHNKVNNKSAAKKYHKKVGIDLS